MARRTDKEPICKSTEHLVDALPVGVGLGLLGGHEAAQINEQQGDAAGNFLVNDYTKGILATLGGGAGAAGLAVAAQQLRSGKRRATLEGRGILHEGQINERLMAEKLRAAEIAAAIGAGAGAGAHVSLNSIVLTPEEQAMQQRADDIALLAGALGGV